MIKLKKGDKVRLKDTITGYVPFIMRLAAIKAVGFLVKDVNSPYDYAGIHFPNIYQHFNLEALKSFKKHDYCKGTCYIVVLPRDVEKV